MTPPRSLRLSALGCLLVLLLVVHVSVRYLLGTLFGFVTYRGLAPAVPFLVLGGYAVVLVGAAVATVIKRRLSGAAVAAGLLVLAVEPVASSVLWGDGCEVGGGATGTLLPPVELRGAAVTLFPWNGACSVSVTVPVVAMGAVLVGAGLLLGGGPTTVAARVLALGTDDGPTRAD